MTIRRRPEDFLVEERLAAATLARMTAAPDDAEAQVIYRLVKTSLTTPAAVEALAQRLGVRAATIGYAGLKDRHARTSQAMSVPLAALGGGKPPRVADGEGWRAELLGYLPDPIAAESIDGNRFTIVVRDLSREANDAMDRRSAALRLGPKDADGAAPHLVTNYFGDQRFGSARHGQGFAARALVRGDFETAVRLLVGTPSRKDHGAVRAITRIAAERWGDWAAIVADAPRIPERRPFESLAEGGDFRDAFAALPAFVQMICVEAYQSHLWNDAARRLMRRWSGAEPGRDDGLLVGEDAFGPLLFLPAWSATPAMRRTVMPLPGPTTALEEPWGEAMAETLAAEGIVVGDLTIPGRRRPFFGEAPRALFVEAGGCVIGRAEPDETAERPAKRSKRTLRFELPRGAYATVVLRALGQ
jgi:tRNA pseudouridine13 synthase